MSTADARRANSIKQKLRPRKGGSQKELEMTESETQSDTQSENRSEPRESPSKFFSFTIDAETAQIVKFESLDAAGARHELTDDEKASLAKEVAEDRLEEVLEQAFEAGIACVLGDSAQAEQTAESDEDAELRHMLLTPLIEHSPARHLLAREALQRIVLDTLIQHAMKPETEAVASSPSTEGIEEGRTAH
jgi:hypothetical protein